MKINAPATRTLAAALLLLVSVAFDAPAQNRPAPPTPSTIRRPSAIPAGAAPRAATQPSGGGVIPVIPVDDSPNALNYQDAMMESQLAFKRAGADMILTYAGDDVARFVRDGKPFNA